MAAELATIPAYTPDQIELIKKTICVGASDDELALFAAVCQRTRLDPFARQIYGIKRKGRLSIQVGIDGFRLAAQRTGEADGQGDPLWCGADGKWVDVWLADGPPAAAKVTVWRRGQSHPYVGVARYSEYQQPGNDLWRVMPAAMLAKCAEALALRKAFPAELSGVYAAEEMDQADDPDPQVRQQHRPAATQPQTAALPPASPNTESQIADAKAKLGAAATLQQLLEIWQPLPGPVKAACLEVKDARKAALTAAATPKPAETPAAESRPADPSLSQLVKRCGRFGSDAEAFSEFVLYLQAEGGGTDCLADFGENAEAELPPLDEMPGAARVEMRDWLKRVAQLEHAKAGA